jgi:hypothetical protein
MDQMDAHRRTSQRQRWLRIVRTAGWLAVVSLLAASLYAPVVSATQPANECATNLFEYSADGAAWRTVVVNDSPTPYPMVSVRVRAKGDLPDGCSRAFSLASYETEGPSWPTSGKQTFLDHDTATLDAQHPSATLTVTAPECFGQTDFYTSAIVNGVYWAGSTRYNGIEGPLPHYPDSPTPYGKIAGSEGGQACAVTPPTPTPTPTPVETPRETPVGGTGPTPTPTGEEQGTGGQPTPGGTGEELGVQGTPAPTPPSTDIASQGTAGTDSSFRLVLAGIAGLMAFALVFSAAPGARATQRVSRKR